MHQLAFHQDHGCYVRRWVGHTPTEDVVLYWKALVNNPRWTPELHALHDMRDIMIIQTWQSIIGRAADFNVKVPEGPGKSALLVKQDHAFGTRRQRLAIDSLEEAVTIVTSSEREARDFVGLPADVPLYPQD